MRGAGEISRRLTAVEESLLQAVTAREDFAAPDAEQDLRILSLLEQWETLLWVLEEEGETVLH